MSTETEAQGTADGPEAIGTITRRDAILRVSALLGGVALVGGSSLLTACGKADEKARATTTAAGVGQFTAADVAFLDEVADTILPDTARSPGAKAARTGAFMALMVTDAYHAREQQIFRDGLRKVDEAARKAANVGFMQATPQQRLAVLTQLDQEQKTYMDARGKAQAEAAKKGKRTETGPQAPPEGTSAQVVAGKKAASDSADKNLSDQRQENAGTGDIASGQVAADAPAHYFRLMKELTMLGYFTSEIGYTKAMRYVESPGRYDGCVAYKPGEPAWAPHA